MEYPESLKTQGQRTQMVRCCRVGWGKARAERERRIDEWPDVSRYIERAWGLEG